MTVNELIHDIDRLKAHYSDIEEYSVTVRKHDKDQLSCSTTVPVESCNVGFDWTMNQLVLVPSLRLTTHPDETQEALKRKLWEMYHEKTRHLSLVASLSKMVKDIKDEDVRKRFEDVLKEF